LGGYSEAAAMLKRNNFYDESFNKSGSFRSKYTLKTIGGVPVVMDEGAGLMWRVGNLSSVMTFEKAENWIKSLNRNKFGGYGDWRLPSLEEAASLLRKKNAEGFYIDPVFPGGLNMNSIWTGDQQRYQTYWTVRFNQGIVYADSDLSEQQALAVRSAE
jgi:hypothetical protein